MSVETTVECQGLPCPQPVLKCRDTIENDSPGTIRVLVDNDPALENVSRYLSHQGYILHKPEKSGSNWIVTASKERHADSSMTRPAAESQVRQSLVLISRNMMGRGNDELGTKLMLNFLSTLPEMGEKLWKIVLVNSGVKLAIDNSPALDSLQILEKEGVSILVCGTCLDFFGLTDKKRVGETTNMLDIVSAMSLADSTVTL